MTRGVGAGLGVVCVCVVGEIDLVLFVGAPPPINSSAVMMEQV